MGQVDRKLLLHILTMACAFLMGASSASASQCQSAKSQADQALAALGPAAQSGAGNMAMGTGSSTAFSSATNPSGGKGGALGPAAANCQQATQKCKQTCDQEASQYEQSQPQRAQQLRQLGDQCMNDMKPLCDQASQQAAADKQHEEKGQENQPSAQAPQQQMPQQSPEEPETEDPEKEEEIKYAKCPDGLKKQGERDNGEPLCGCPSGQQMVSNSEAGNPDLTEEDAMDELLPSDLASEYQCVVIAPKPEEEDPEDPQPTYEDTSVRTVNNNRAGGPSTDISQGDAPQSAYFRPRSTTSDGSGTSSNAYNWRGLSLRDYTGEEEDEEGEEDEIAYVPPQLLNEQPYRRVAAIKPMKGYRSKGEIQRRLRPVGNVDAALAEPLPAANVDPGAAEVAKALMDPKAHTNPHIEIDLEGQKIAMLIESPDPLSLCKVADRIRLLESGGVYAARRAIELRNMFNSRVSRVGGEAGLDMLCTTSDNAF